MKQNDGLNAPKIFTISKTFCEEAYANITEMQNR